MSRAERWWRPAPRRNVRPASRARRHVVSDGDVTHAFGLGYDIGQADERKRHERRDEMLHRLAEACEQGPDAIEAVAREFGYDDDLLDVAESAGVAPIEDVEQEDVEQLLDELDEWLRNGGDDGAS